MAIAQDTIVTVGSGATAKSFGVSKTLDQYTLEELKAVGDWSYSAYNDNIYNANLFKVIDRTGTIISIENNESAIRLTTLSPNQLFTEGYNLQSEGVFFRNVLVYWETGLVTDWSSHTIFYGSSSLESKRIVTDIELQDLKIAINSTDINAYNSTYTTCKLGVNDVAICPMQLLVTPDNVYLNMALPFNGGRGTAGNMNSWLTYRLISYNNPNIKTYTDYKNLRTIDGALTDTLYMAPNGVDYALESGLQNKTFTASDSIVSCDSYEWGGYRFFRYQLNQTNLDAPYIWHAYAGVKFELDGVTYKPIVNNGMITGYTDDMSEESEWDTWENIKDHVTPSVRPSPTPPGPGPYDDDPWSGVSFSGVGVGGAGAFAKCYYMTSTELANLRSWMNSNNVPEGFDPMAQIIGLSQVPVSLSGDDNDTVKFVNSSAVYDPGVTRLVDSGVSTQIAMGTPKRYSLGSVDIVRRMQERGEPYLDYDCQIELYLPLIGMFSLDTQAVMGSTITAEAVLDPISGTLAAYAYVSRDGQNLPIAYGSTTIGVDLPISAQQYSVSRAALKQANAQLGSSILSSTLSFIAAATAGGKGSGTGAKTATGTTNGLAAAGIREAGADYMKASQAGNVFGDFMQWGRTIRQLSYGNNTAIAGSFGGSTAQWSYPFTPYVKIIRPRYEKPLNYAHSQGVPCVQTKKVGSCTGFIQCIGVDVSGITRATDLERQAIQAALANGVFAGGGS